MTTILLCGFVTDAVGRKGVWLAGSVAVAAAILIFARTRTSRGALVAVVLLGIGWAAQVNVSNVLKAVPHARRLLESRFKKLIGRTPHQEIVRAQVNRVKQLLTETELSLQEIAERSGFRHVEYLSVAFKREVGMPPSRYRAENRP